MNYLYDVSVIIVNYNGKKYIKTLFDSLMRLAHSDFNYEIVFVDNASSDGSIEFLKNNYLPLENLLIVPSEKNLGFAGGNNLGVSKANGQYIVLLNNDTKPNEDWLEELYHYIRNKPDVVMANSKLLFFNDYFKINFFTRDKIIFDRNIRINNTEYRIDSKFCKNNLCEEKQIVCFGHTELYIPLLYGDNPHTIEFKVIDSSDDDSLIQNENHYAIKNGEPLIFQMSNEEISKSKIILIQNAGSGINEELNGFDIGFCHEDGEQYNKEYEINNGCGASIIFRKEEFDKCGGFDSRFFMYYEDTDLSYRMKKNGGKIMYCPSSIVRHVHAGSSGEWSPFFTYHVCKNKLLFVAKNYGFLMFFKYYIKQTFDAIRNKDVDKLKGTQAALWMIFDNRYF